jgi:hypothetical protein
MNLTLEALETIDAPISNGDGVTILLVAWELGVIVGAAIVLT